MIGFKSLEYPYPYIPAEDRRTLLREHTICSVAPAEDDFDNFITGSGSLRVQSSGHPYLDTMIYSQELLYEPLWEKTPLPPDLVSDGTLKKIREELLKPQTPETEARMGQLLDEAQKKAGFEKYMNFDNKILYPTGSPRMHTAFWLTFKQPEAKETRDYLRFLDMQNGMITSMWTNEKGSYRSESFASYKADVIINRLSAPAGELNTEITMELPGKPFKYGNMFFNNPFVGCTQEITQEDDAITLAWAYRPERGHKGFVVSIRFIAEGERAVVRKVEEELTDVCGRPMPRMIVENADRLTVVSKIVKFESDFTFELAKPIAEEVRSMIVDFDDLLAANEAYIGERMDRSRIHIGRKEDYVLSGEELLRRSHKDKALDPMLLEKLYDMGRFLQIYETGKLPPMMGQHNINTNLQVCAGNNTGLFDEMDVYFKYYESKFDDFRLNAKLLFGARGLLASVHCDPDSGLYYHFSRTYPHYAWTGCLGWIYNELWGYYLVTGDKKFLAERVLPAYEEMALFFEDYACDRDDDGKVIFYPSFSPENPTPNPGYETVTCKSLNPTRINSVMDIAICREILMNLISGSRDLGINEDKIPHWEQQLQDLPTYLLDEEGSLKEWAWPTIEENYNHRHVSHHYDVWPGRAITPETEPELTEAILISNRKRGQQDDSAHGIIHRAFTAIRLRDEEEMVQNISQLLNHGFVRRTLQTSHFPYRGVFPDLQGAVPAFLIEMCVSSMPGIVEFLPLLADTMEEGSIDGIWLYTGAKLQHMEWTKTGARAILISNEDQTLTLRMKKNGAKLFVNGAELELVNGQAEYTFKGGEETLIEMTF